MMGISFIKPSRKRELRLPTSAACAGRISGSMNTRVSGSARVDSTNVLPSGELRGQTKLVKITEDVRKYVAEQSIADEDALQAGIEQKAREFSQAGAEVYAKS